MNLAKSARDQFSVSEIACFTQEVIIGKPSARALEWLAQGFKALERADCDVPLQRFLAMPTRKRQRRNCRDFAISQAIKLTRGANFDERCRRLAAEVEFFKCKGPWTCWRKAGGPSLAASDLQKAMYEIVRNHDGKVMPCSRTISRAVARTNHPQEVSESSPYPERLPTTKPASNPAVLAVTIEG